MRSTGQKAGTVWRALAAVLVVLLAGIGAVERRDAQAQGSQLTFYLVAHPEHGAMTVDRSFLADAFLKKRTKWSDGRTIHPVDQRPDATVRAHFSKQVLRRSVLAVRSYWQQRIFTGRGVPPPELDSDEMVIQHVLKNPGAVGYVSARAETKGVRLLELR